MAELDLITIGRSSVDLYGTQVGGRLEDMRSFEKYIGGSPTNIAAGAARLGLKSALITRVGDEHMGRFIREELKREGVDTTCVITDPEQARRYGTLIHSEGRRLSEVVEQALALAGAQSNHAALDLTTVAVGPLLEQTLARCRPTLDPHHADVTLDLPDGLPPVRADAAALEAALCNLIANAAKYGGPDGWIGLEARHQTHGRTPGVQITVRDHGPGIPADELPHLFEPFFRGRAARQAQIRGSGLGLSLVKNTVEAHGGRVTVESAVGQGSAFTIHLPVDLTSVKRET